MFADIFTNIGGMLAEVTPIISSSDWDTIATTATTTAQAAVPAALGILAIVISVPVAKKVFKRVAS